MSDNILAINAGSYSLKFQLLALPQGEVRCQRIVEQMGKRDAGKTAARQRCPADGDVSARISPGELANMPLAPEPPSAKIWNF